MTSSCLDIRVNICQLQLFCTQKEACSGHGRCAGCSCSLWLLAPGLPAQVVGPADLAKIIRLQFARMRPGINIKVHRDKGKWAVGAHRIHIPVTAAPGVGFQV